MENENLIFLSLLFFICLGIISLMIVSYFENKKYIAIRKK